MFRERIGKMITYLATDACHLSTLDQKTGSINISRLQCIDCCEVQSHRNGTSWVDHGLGGIFAFLVIAHNLA